MEGIKPQNKNVKEGRAFLFGFDLSETKIQYKSATNV